MKQQQYDELKQDMLALAEVVETSTELRLIKPIARMLVAKYTKGGGE